MKAYERLIKYTKHETASDSSVNASPTTPEQLLFAKALEKELLSLGVTQVKLDENGYVTASIPASKGYEDCTPIGFIAHMDVSAEVSCNDVKTRIVSNYNGEDILLEGSREYISPKEYAELKNYIGKSILVTDGTTLLGADDKAGIAEIMSAIEYMINSDMPHGPVKIAFTPDEEIGSGAALLNIEEFGAKYAYTLDGAGFGEISWENFNATSASIGIQGFNIHPGSAKGKMINASLIAAEIINMLPENARPDTTEGREGFFHLINMRGDVEGATLNYIIRDHDSTKLEEKHEALRKIVADVSKKYPGACIALNFSESYRNMGEIIKKDMYPVEVARRAITNLGGVARDYPTRGGTDGARLSFRGLPCPNLGTGSHNHHSVYEYACVEEMDKCTQMVIEIIKIYSEKG
ncbi:MAG: peptidase T [Clostridiales bacterium]|nr:peptidase T [Clostridiales bacterium]